MTAITRNLPPFVRDLGVSLVGQKCYTSLVENLNITDLECIKYTLSKGLGIGIVVGGAIMKVPQLFLIVSARSARGLSLSAFVLETLSYAITLAYSYRNQFPFSTYGENFFLTIQNTLITLLIIYYPRSSLRTSRGQGFSLTAAVISIVVVAFALYDISLDVLSLLQLSTLPLSLFSKFPQIRQNFRSKSTGQLSAFAVISQIVGCLARLFTTATELDDIIITAGFALALVLNSVLGAQMWMYWGKDAKDDYERAIPITATEHEKSIPLSWAAPEPPTARIHSPTAQHGSQPSGRKWARKSVNEILRVEEGSGCK